MTEREKELGNKYNKNKICLNSKQQICLIQHKYLGPRDYQIKQTLSGFYIPNVLISNPNSEVNKGNSKSSYAINTHKYWYNYYRQCGLRSIYIKKIDSIVDGWLIWDNNNSDLPSDKKFDFITTYELFKLLNEHYPEDYKGYGEIDRNYPSDTIEYKCLVKCNFQPWNWSEKRLISHLRYRSNDIDCYKLDENYRPIEVYEAKSTQAELDKSLIKYASHYRFREKFHREIEGLELKYVTDDKVFVT